MNSRDESRDSSRTNRMNRLASIARRIAVLNPSLLNYITKVYFKVQSLFYSQQNDTRTPYFIPDPNNPLPFNGYS